MSRNTEDRADRVLRRMHLRNKMTRLNAYLDRTELAIMDMMRIKDTPTFEELHSLIGERENTKYKLKELHKKLYG